MINTKINNTYEILTFEDWTTQKPQNWSGFIMVWSGLGAAYPQNQLPSQIKNQDVLIIDGFKWFYYDVNKLYPRYNVLTKPSASFMSLKFVARIRNAELENRFFDLIKTPRKYATNPTHESVLSFIPDATTPKLVWDLDKLNAPIIKRDSYHWQDGTHQFENLQLFDHSNNAYSLKYNTFSDKASQYASFNKTNSGWTTDVNTTNASATPTPLGNFTHFKITDTKNQDESYSLFSDATMSCFEISTIIPGSKVTTGIHKGVINFGTFTSATLKKSYLSHSLSNSFLTSLGTTFTKPQTAELFNLPIVEDSKYLYKLNIQVNLIKNGKLNNANQPLFDAETITTLDILHEDNTNINQVKYTTLYKDASLHSTTNQRDVIFILPLLNNISQDTIVYFRKI